MTGISSYDLSPWGMYLQADVVVKAVMIGLVIASIITWTVWLAKTFELMVARRHVCAGLAVIRHVNTLSGAAAILSEKKLDKGVVAQLVQGAMDEVRRSGISSVEGIKERATLLLSRIESRAGRKIATGTGILATIGSTAPFVGLFGTVWGIMNAFVGIAEANTTNLAVVAPGLAEALLATGIGLAAAIPAVIFYNVFARSIASYKGLVGDAATEVLRHLSRELDHNAEKA